MIFLCGSKDVVKDSNKVLWKEELDFKEENHTTHFNGISVK